VNAEGVADVVDATDTATPEVRVGHSPTYFSVGHSPTYFTDSICTANDASQCSPA